MAPKKPPAKKSAYVIKPPPPAPTAASKVKPLGVPADYSASVPEQYRPPAGQAGQFLPAQQVPPTFKQGDEFLPASFSPEKIAMLQRQLATAGLIGPKSKFRLGLWDDTTRTAYKNLLEYANAAGYQDELSALKNYAKAEVVDPSGAAGATRAPLTIKKSNPTDLFAIADTTARATLGRKLTDAEKAKLSSAFQSLEVGEQTTDYNQAPTGGTSVGAPNAQAFMAEKIRKDYGVEAGAFNIGEAGNKFLDLLNQVGG